MGVQQFMLGRELPCTVMELLDVRQLPLPGKVHESLVAQVESGRAYPDVLYRLGLSHLGRQELGLARTRLEAAVAIKPDYVLARLALAAVCDLLALHAEAVDQLDAVLKSDTLSNELPSRYRILCAGAFCQERCGQTGAAAFRYEQAIAAEPQDLFAHYRLAAIHLAHNQLDEAIQHHRAILNHEPQEQAVRTSLAHLLQLSDRHQEAVWEYEKALCLDPDNWDLQLELADQFERMGNGSAAISRLRNLCEKHPQFPDLHLRLANLHSERGDDQAATEQYTEALAIHPDYLDCHIAFARHELAAGRTEAAISHFQTATSINDRNVEAYAGLAVALQRLGKTSDASEMLNCALNISGNSDLLVAQLGKLELQIQSSLTTEQTLHTEARSTREPAQSTEDRQQMRHEVERQIRHYAEILADHPTWTDIRVRYGMMLKLVGRVQEAASAFEEALKEDPAYVEGWVQLAMVRRQLGDNTAAITAMEQAIKIRPQTAGLHYRLGLLYCSEMEFDLAMERMEHAAELAGQKQDFQRRIWVVMQGLELNRKSAGTIADALTGSRQEQTAKSQAA